ncbi:hypothetical protein K449DRAFT_433684 [Hypoxylon sp. EC38]|nr:hypothetical protein K449DRAFT_433684 [Hypoxylon sp. EC38]
MHTCSGMGIWGSIEFAFRSTQNTLVATHSHQEPKTENQRVHWDIENNKNLPITRIVNAEDQNSGGRKRNVDILDCYLRQNLVSNGGYLDEVSLCAHLAPFTFILL